MKIIDFKRKGNVIRFFLGEKTKDWGWTRPDYKDYTGKTPDWLKPSDIYYGDDWNDRPYEHNAGQVYDKFVKGHIDVNCKYDDLVLEPSSGELNSSYSKDDMRDRKVPCIIIVPKEVIDEDEELYYETGFEYWNNSNDSRIIRYFFGDEA